MGPHSMLRSDPSRIEGKSLSASLLRRVWGFARPYRAKIAAFLTAIVVAALRALVPPLLFRSILDTAIPQADRGMVTTLATLSVLAALADSGLQVLQRWWSSQIGEGLIFDLRTALFDHVQRMPVAFF